MDATRSSLQESVDNLAMSLDDYTIYLRQQTKVVKDQQSSLSVGDSGTVKVLPVNVSESVSGRIEPLFTALQEKPVYHKVAVNSFAPMDPKQKYTYIRDLEKGLPIPTICSHSVDYHCL